MYSSSFGMAETMNGNQQMNRVSFLGPTSSAMDFLVSSAEDESNDTLYCEHDDEEHDNGEKASKSRERNREHAKRTRLRKKAMLEGMKGKLMDLQRESTKLQQAFEERRTANILIAFSKPTTDDGTEESSNVLEMTKEMYAENVELSSYKGNIIEQLRTKVRTEAAQKNQHATMLRQSMKSNGVTFLESRLRRDSICSDSGLKEFNESSSSSSSSSTSVSSSSAATITTTTDSAVVDIMDSDNDDVDLESYQPLPKSIVNWKSGTVINEDGQERRLADEEVEQFRKERNRIHAKLTRDRKKLFTSRMQQMITSLERQNMIMRNRLKTLATATIPGMSSVIPTYIQNSPAKISPVSVITSNSNCSTSENSKKPIEACFSLQSMAHLPTT